MRALLAVLATVLALVILTASTVTMPPRPVVAAPAPTALPSLPPVPTGTGWIHRDLSVVTRSPSAAGPSSFSPYSLLQLNLCNSGYAGCYAGAGSAAEGASVIRRTRPTMVTLAEICADDIPAELLPALADAWPADHVYALMVPAIDRRTGNPYRCRNGQYYGNAVLGRVPAEAWQGVRAYNGVYPDQSTRGGERRVFGCVYAVGDHLACATHLASRTPSAALAQCRLLTAVAIPYIRSVEGVSTPVVVGGDLNLNADLAQQCVPPGSARVGDGVQHVMSTRDLRIAGTETFPLAHSDHDAFLVRLDPVRR